MSGSASGASEWAQRIAWIVERYEEGNASAMARRIGITQQSLSRLTRAGVPRGDTLAAILRAYPHLSPEWLLLGTGPRERAPDSGRAAVRELVAALEAVLDQARERYG